MKRSRFLWLGLMLGLPLSVLADTHYVSNTGSDTFPYTSWATATDSIKLALDAADPWDTVLVAAGNYTADSLPMKVGMVFKGAGMDSTYVRHNGNYPFLVLFGDSSLVQGFHFDGKVDTSSSGVLTYHLYVAVGSGSSETVVIRGNRVTNTKYAVYLIDSDNIQVEDNFFSHFYSGTFMLFAHAEIRDNVFLMTNSTISGAIGQTGRSSIIERNTIISYVRIGGVIDVDDADSTAIRNNILISSPVSQTFNVCINCASGGGSTVGLVENNLCVGGWVGMSVFGNGIVIRNNIITGSLYLDLAYDTSTTAPGEARFNLFWDNSNLEHPIFDSAQRIAYGSLFADPMFVDTNDYHLQTFSPAIDAGDSLLLDPDGSRSDIGPYGGPLGETYTYLDLPPRVPTGLAGVPSDTAITLTWRGNHEADFSHYDLYRDTSPMAAPDSALLIAAGFAESTYVDQPVSPGGSYYYRLRAVDGQENTSGLSDELSVVATGVLEPPVLPVAIELRPNYPNPFNASTVIPFTVTGANRSAAAHLMLELFDIRGRRVRVLLDEVLPAGDHHVVWDGKDAGGGQAGSGVYFVRLLCDSAVLCRKILLLR